MLEGPFEAVADFDVRRAAMSSPLMRRTEKVFQVRPLDPLIKAALLREAVQRRQRSPRTMPACPTEARRTTALARVALFTIDGAPQSDRHAVDVPKPARHASKNATARISAMQLMPATPNHTAGRRWETSSMMSSSLRAVVVGNATIAAIAAIAMTTAKVLKSTGPPRAAMRLGVVPRKMIANTPSAIPTMAKSRCGLALWAIVPWVKLRAQPTATPATKCNTARGAKSETIAAVRNARHASANPAAAAVRESIRLNRGAKRPGIGREAGVPSDVHRFGVRPFATSQSAICYVR